MKKILVGLFVFSIVLPAAELDFGVDFGVKGGFPFTDLFGTGNVLNGTPVSLHQSRNYLVGPAVELRLPLGFAFEADGIYRDNSTQLVFAGGLPASFSSSSWEIPYLGKFRFPIPLIKPFVEAGGAYRTFDNLPAGTTATHNAFVAGGGIELHVSHIRLSGEVRYLHWGSPPSNVAVRLVQSQGEVLFGLMFQP